MPKVRFCNPGRFNRKLSVLKHSVTSDELGQPVETYTARSNPWWAEKKEMRASERFAATQEIGAETVVFEGHWDTDIAYKDRLSLDDKTYDIEGLIELGFRERLQIIATAVKV